MRGAGLPSRAQARHAGYNESEWRRKCYEPQRMAVCRRTGKYRAPSGGRVWQADR